MNGRSAEEEGRVDLEEPLLGQRHAETKESSEDTQSFLKFLTFGWLTPLLRAGAQKPLEFEDLSEISRLNLPAKLKAEFDAKWNEEEKSSGTAKVSLMKILVKLHRKTLLRAYLLKFMQIIVNFSRPLILEALLYD